MGNDAWVDTEFLDDVKKWDEYLNKFESKLSLPPTEWRTDLEIQEYLTMNRTVLAGLSPEDCAEIRFQLSQYSLYIQRVKNTETARMNYIEARLKNIVANEVDQYSGYAYEERFQKAIKADSYCSKLFQVKLLCKQRIDRLNYVSNGIYNLAQTLKELQYSKERAPNV